MPSPNDLFYQLLHDESFAHWVHRTDASAIAYWEGWLASHPEHRDTADTAARVLKGIAFVPRQVPEHQIQQDWARLKRRAPELTETIPSSRRRPTYRSWRIAASVAIMLLSVALWWTLVHRPAEVTYTTAYGETLDIKLPDGSSATLNANSEMIYWETDEPKPTREVKLTGEAFFDVVHQKTAQPTPFMVRTPDLSVRVLGTEFNVNTRRGRTQVVLDEGLVELQLPTETSAAMQPGELVEYQAPSDQVRRATVDTELFTAWRERRLKFDDTPLAEVAQLLQENYGVRIHFSDEQLGRRRVTGEISARELDTILLALSKLFNISIQRSGDTVRIAQQHVSS